MVKIEKDYERVPAVLLEQGAAETEKLIEAFENGETQFDFDNKIYGDKSVKNELKRVQHGKCCFCEAKVGHIAYGDVEHFRPKAAYCVDGDPKLNYPGYFWLAYDFSNLFFSCQVCNQSYKKNYFPLVDEAKRCRSNEDALEDEEALLIHPEHEEPADFIGFRGEMALPIDGNPKGEKTIQYTGMNRAELVEQRHQYLLNLETTLLIAESNLPGAKEAKAFVRTLAQKDKPYSLMIQSNFPEFAP